MKRCKNILYLADGAVNACPALGHVVALLAVKPKGFLSPVSR